MEVYKSNLKDLDHIMDIYATARDFMIKTGNPTQWNNSSPSKEIVKEDIEKGNHYSIKEDGIIYGVFSFIPGPDLTYSIIEGKWLNDEEYSTIHRIASSGKKKNIFKICLKYCELNNPNIRIDTHENNKVMLHILKIMAFHFVGLFIWPMEVQELLIKSVGD